MSPSAQDAPARRWIIAAVIAAVVVVAAIVFVATRGSSDDDNPVVATGTPTPTVGVETPSGVATSSPATSASATPRATASSAKPTATTTPRATTAPGVRPTEAPAPLDDTATPTQGVTAELAKIESVTGVAELPGEVGGPALRVTVKITNGTDDDFDLTGAVVVLYQGEQRAPAIELTRPGGRPLPSSVGAGKSVTGVYVFNVPTAQRNPVEVEVDLASKVPVVVFRGDARPFG